jgi:hypothetical protein
MDCSLICVAKCLLRFVHKISAFTAYFGLRSQDLGRLFSTSGAVLVRDAVA